MEIHEDSITNYLQSILKRIAVVLKRIAGLKHVTVVLVKSPPSPAGWAGAPRTGAGSGPGARA